MYALVGFDLWSGLQELHRDSMGIFGSIVLSRYLGEEEDSFQVRLVVENLAASFPDFFAIERVKIEPNAQTEFISCSISHLELIAHDRYADHRHAVVDGLTCSTLARVSDEQTGSLEDVQLRHSGHDEQVGWNLKLIGFNHLLQIPIS